MLNSSVVKKRIIDKVGDGVLDLDKFEYKGMNVKVEFFFVNGGGNFCMKPSTLIHNGISRTNMFGRFENSMNYVIENAKEVK